MIFSFYTGLPCKQAQVGEPADSTLQPVRRARLPLVLDLLSLVLHLLTQSGHFLPAPLHLPLDLCLARLQIGDHLWLQLDRLAQQMLQLRIAAVAAVGTAVTTPLAIVGESETETKER